MQNVELFLIHNLFFLSSPKPFCYLPDTSVNKPLIFQSLGLQFPRILEPLGGVRLSYLLHCPWSMFLSIFLSAWIKEAFLLLFFHRDSLYLCLSFIFLNFLLDIYYQIPNLSLNNFSSSTDVISSAWQLYLRHPHSHKTISSILLPT